MQYGRMQIVRVNPLVHGAVTEIIRRAVCCTSPDTGPGEQRSEAEYVVVAALVHLQLPSALDHRRAPELAADDNERLIEESALLQIRHQRSDRRIGRPRQHAVRTDILMAVPRLVNTPGALPAPGLTDNQPPPLLVEALAEKFKAPPELEIETVWEPVYGR